MRKANCLGLLITFALLLNGCADFPLSSLTQGLPSLGKAAPASTQSASQTVAVPVDVDTAFARVKSAFRFVSADELGAIRSASWDGSWKAAAITEGAYAWDEQPGAYYRMGRDYGDPQYHESILVELEKNGAGTRMTVIFSSSNAAHLSDAYAGPLFAKVKQVAEGKTRGVKK